MYVTYFKVFYGSTTDSNSIFVFWVINNEVNLSRLRYQLPGVKYRVSICFVVELHLKCFKRNIGVYLCEKG